MSEARKKIDVRIGSATYHLVTAENEQYTRQIAARADERIYRIMQANPQLGQQMATVLALVNSIDELSRLYQQAESMDNQRQESERKAEETRHELMRLREQNWELKKELLRLVNEAEHNPPAQPDEPPPHVKTGDLDLAASAPVMDRERTAASAVAEPAHSAAPASAEPTTLVASTTSEAVEPVAPVAAEPTAPAVSSASEEVETVAPTSAEPITPVAPSASEASEPVASTSTAPPTPVASTDDMPELVVRKTTTHEPRAAKSPSRKKSASRRPTVPATSAVIDLGSRDDLSFPESMHSQLDQMTQTDLDSYLRSLHAESKPDA